MKLGCHCVLFRERIATETEVVLNELAKTGFQGVELGARFFGTERKSYLQKALHDAGIELAAIHVGVPPEVWQNAPEKAIDTVLEAARFMQDMPNQNITMSCSPGEDLIAIAKNMNRAALECKKLGVTLHYHNHAAEFLNGGAMYLALKQHAPDLYFGFDLGWVQKGGWDIYEVLESNRGRCSYVHLRDFTEAGTLSEGKAEEYSAYTGGVSHEFPDIGEGTVDFHKLLTYLENYFPQNGWAVVEYETGDQDFGRYAKARAYLKNQWEAKE